MKYTSLEAFLSQSKPALAKGPLAIVFAEDEIELDTTLRHHLNAGFAEVVLLSPDIFDLPAEVEEKIHRIRYDVHAEQALLSAVNRLIEAAPGIWMYYCYNAEYLFFPFCETRNIREMISFQIEERREAFLAYVVDLYADDLSEAPNAVSLERACLDKSGYYALARPDPANHNHPKERQLDFLVVCVGVLKSISHPPNARSTASHCFAPSPG